LVGDQQDGGKKRQISTPVSAFFAIVGEIKINSSLTNKTIQLLNTQTKQKQHKKQQIK
jgi:hypothetical protein